MLIELAGLSRTVRWFEQWRLCWLGRAGVKSGRAGPVIRLALRCGRNGLIGLGCRTRATVPAQAQRSSQQSSITFGISDAGVNNSESMGCRDSEVLVADVRGVDG